MSEPKLGDWGQCEAHDLIRTADDAIDVRCTRMGRRIREQERDLGRVRWRIVCEIHGLATAMEVQ